jgi:GNAT superfamily N-acetyltransferase
MEGPADFSIRRATLQDIPALARHRCEMFRDMGQLRDDAYPLLADATAAYYAQAMPAGEYVAWVVSPASQPDVIVAGGGMQLRRILPRPTREGYLLTPGPQGLIVNVYTEHAYRRRGLGEMIMLTIIEWSRENGVASLVLHASDMGRPLYERLGFTQTSEMSYPLARLSAARQAGGA